MSALFQPMSCIFPPFLIISSFPAADPFMVCGLISPILPPQPVTGASSFMAELLYAVHHKGPGILILTVFSFRPDLVSGRLLRLSRLTYFFRFFTPSFFFPCNLNSVVFVFVPECFPPSLFKRIECGTFINPPLRICSFVHNQHPRSRGGGWLSV